MKTWAVVNQKGGVGKTTTAITLAGQLAMTPGRRLLVDLDPQGSLTSYLGYDPDHIDTGIFRLFEEPTSSQSAIAQMLLPTSIHNTWLFAASSILARYDRQIDGNPGQGLVVKRALASVAARFENAIIDCPPMLGSLMINALAACGQLLIPAQTDYLSINGLQRIMHTLAMVEKSLARDIPSLIVPTMFDRRTRASIDALRKIRDSYGDNVWTSCIPVDTKFRDASKAGLPISQHAPGCRGDRAYRELLEQLLSPVAEKPAVGQVA